jgi:hypothetical protein
VGDGLVGILVELREAHLAGPEDDRADGEALGAVGYDDGRAHHQRAYEPSVTGDEQGSDLVVNGRRLLGDAGRDVGIGSC